ncbi:aldehyde dehydrogenase family protein [Pelagicoccus albus]|uniref:Aldehyde dehydrogenase n=1 Tax=Pelagicoccus albus TaxID=415222 RepID=A0A7X1B901_9BACT|nr:aldehyde dehydrogenase family protein [Pelagicoccus albus]MBC2607886.1 aldehyde dehydrogenase [Pelagicoccus albus]
MPEIETTLNSDGRTIESFAPATGHKLGNVAESDLRSIPTLIANLRHGQSSWRQQSLDQRSEVLLAVADSLQSDSSGLSELLAEESGKPIAQARFEVTITIEYLRAIATKATAYKPEQISTQDSPGITGDRIISRRVPFGLVAAILPFNFPVELYVEKVAAAIAMGNSVLVKAPPQTPLIVERVTKHFHSGGVPKESLHCVYGGADLGRAIATSPGIDLISLTGSTAAGISVAELSAANLPKLHLELGGNDPAILLEDADLDLAVPHLIFGRTLMNGQACASNKRILVHESLHDALAERLKSELAKISIGDPLDESKQLGPMISSDAARRVVSQVKHAIEQGGELLFGELETHGAFVSPFLLGRVPATADIAKDDEIFGPVLPLIPFDTDKRAIEIANQSSYGLSSGVFSRDWQRAESVANEIEAGGTVINGTGNYRPYIVPFGGVKMSGLGREGLGFTLEEMSQLKYTVWRSCES